MAKMFVMEIVVTTYNNLWKKLTFITLIILFDVSLNINFILTENEFGFYSWVYEGTFSAFYVGK